MKKNLVFIICFFIFMNTSWAISLDCPSVASPGEIIKLHVKEGTLNGLKAKYNFGSSFVYHDVKLNSSWKDYYTGIYGFSVGNVSNSDMLIMDIDLKVDMNVLVNNNYTLELIDIEGNNTNYKSVDLDNVSCEIKAVSDINTLDSLVIDGVIFSSKFEKNVVSYEGITKEDKIVIKATASDDAARVEGDVGEQILKIGVNTFKIKVISSRGNVREYVVYITRMIDKKSSDITLKSLTLSAGNIDFRKDNFLYFVDIPFEVDNLDIQAVPTDKNSMIEIIKPNNLAVGENRFEIVVTAEDGSNAVYVIVVNRLAKPSSDATIKNLIIKNYEFNFKSSIYEYSLVISDEDKLDIDVILNDEKAKYWIRGNKNLKNNSVINIEVEAENGDVVVYKLYISMPDKNNSSSIIEYIELIPLFCFVFLQAWN